MPAEQESLHKIKSLLGLHSKGMTTSEISRHFKWTRNSTAKYLEILLSNREIERKQVGPSRMYTLAKRVSLKSLMNHISQFVIVFDSHRKIIAVNESLTRFFNVHQEKVEGKTLREIPIDLFQCLDNNEAICNPEKEVLTELESRVAGTPHHFRIRSVPTQFEDHDTGFTIIVEDISALKTYETELARSEEKYRAVIEAQTDLIFRRRLDGTVTYVNREFLRFFRKTAREVEGTRFCPADLRLRGASAPVDVSLSLLPFYKDVYEQCVLLDHGEVRWIQWKNISLKDAGGVVTEIQSVGRDITIQRQREREILLKRSALESAPYALVLFDVVGRIVYANKAFHSLFRCPDHEDIVGEPFDRFIPQEGVGNNMNQLSRSLMETGNVDGVLKGRQYDSTEINLEVHGGFIKNDLHFPYHGLLLIVEKNGALPAQQLGIIPQSNRAGSVCGNLLLDPAGQLVSANRKFLALTGYPEETQILGKSVGNLLDAGPNNPESLFTPPIESSRAATVRYDGHIMQKDGGRLPARFYVRHICDPAGRHLCSEVRVEPAGPPVTVTTEPMADLYPVPLFITDLQRRVVWWNSAMEAFTGVRKAEIIGKTQYQKAFYPYFGVEPLLIDLVDQQLGRIHQTYPLAKKFGDMLILERYIPDSATAEGRYIYEKASPLYTPAGTLIGFIGGVADITDWKRSRELMVRLKQEIEESLSPRIQEFLEKTGEHSGKIPPV